MLNPKQDLTAGEIVLRAVIFFITLPYYRVFAYNTRIPIEDILRSAQRLYPLPPAIATDRALDVAEASVTLHHHKRKKTELDKLTELLIRWSARKKHELEFISLAAVAITAIVAASMSWGGQLILVYDDERKPHWVGPAWWFTSLTLSVCGILSSAQQMGVLTLIGAVKKIKSRTSFPTEKDQEKARKKQLRMVKRYLTQLVTEVQVGKPLSDTQEAQETQFKESSYKLSYKMMLTWQIPMMFLGYSFVSYFIGLTIIVCTPLFREHGARIGDPGTNIAISYLAVSTFAWGIFNILFV